VSLEHAEVTGPLNLGSGDLPGFSRPRKEKMIMYAMVLLNHPEGYDESGRMFVCPDCLEWQQVSWLDPWDCGHQETMCAMCVDTWNLDFEIQLPEGIDA
jgi:hypothetical protein